MCIRDRLQKREETPIHLRPYDKKKYEVPSTKLKYNSGYVLLDIEPMPRAKIMKLCYLILDRLKEIPEKALYRIYTEEKLKFIMNKTDQLEDIRELEEALGHESIEVFIQLLHREIMLVDQMKVAKPWEPRKYDSEIFKFGKTKEVDLKHRRFDRPEREKVKFIEK
eukprot:TRINITY_DN2962_c0_g1_i17.p1 TRINITY_DN2962_c0_g1~~TRINITY_DN2962_c0_g1_i17.p1  ORF type:complete len:166 (+),score=43.90 TRINITY_DN2962_c0_g1_i17:65-562(+)